MLGGATNFAADRDLVHRITRTHPELPRPAQANRTFLRRVLAAAPDARCTFTDSTGRSTMDSSREMSRSASGRCATIDT